MPQIVFPFSVLLTNIAARNLYPRPKISSSQILPSYLPQTVKMFWKCQVRTSEELIILISSDELPVKMEKDVFDIILAWINHDRNMQKNCFTELFRHVRLVYISRDSLCSDIVTNDLVTDNEGCQERIILG